MLDYANDKKNVLGQYFTNSKLVSRCLENFQLCDNIVEPSYGSGNFLKQLPPQSIGIELDDELYKNWHNENCLNLNFYDWHPQFGANISFVGNPPYRLPAYSLTTHNEYIKKLCKKHGIKGIKEEAILFVVKTFDIFFENNVSGNIGYILPKSIFTNSSKAYISFKEFCLKNLNLIRITEVIDEFDNVSQDLVWVEWRVEPQVSKYFLFNEDEVLIDDFWCHKKDVIEFMDIFKKTYLGSQLVESFLLSCSNESIDAFKERLIKLYNATDLNESNLIDYLSFNGSPHLIALQKKDSQKIIRVLKDIAAFKTTISHDEITNLDNYQKINHRTEIRYYFRHQKLEKQKQFVYILNKGVGPSFYFPGNPTKSSTDYFGFCDYDINRNCSPGANRSVPLNGIENNLTDEFKEWWQQNTYKPFSEIFNYLMFVSKSNWYKNYKKSLQRFYFAIPKQFLIEFNEL